MDLGGPRHYVARAMEWLLILSAMGARIDGAGVFRQHQAQLVQADRHLLLIRGDHGVLRDRSARHPDRERRPRLRHPRPVLRILPGLAMLGIGMGIGFPALSSRRPVGTGASAVQVVPSIAPLVDRLVWRALQRGVGAVIAQAPRAAIDCNRAEDEIDPTVIRSGPIPSLSPRARGGLGIIPGRTATHGALWRQPIPRHELEERLTQAHRPYHRAIEEMLKRLLDQFGCALLLDCHSMPPPDSGPSVIIGDRYGQSAAPWVTSEAVKIVASIGFRVGVNQPFAGGHVVQRHGAPARGIHALQIEIDRRLYLQSNVTRRGPGFAKVSRLFEELAMRLGQSLLDRRFSEAAE